MQQKRKLPDTDGHCQVSAYGTGKDARNYGRRGCAGGIGMTAKLFGSLLLVGAGLYIALLLARYEHRRVGVLDGYLSLLRFIRGQIDCFSMPIGQILATVDPSVLAACRGQDRASAERPAASLPLLLHESRGYLGAESERLLTCFARELGHTHRAEQVGRCDYYLSALEEQRGRLADSLPARTRTDSALCLSCALAAAILLW